MMVLPYWKDEDGDNMPDSWEKRNGLDIDSNDAFADDDSDGLVNIYEYLFSTDPNDTDTDNDGLSDGAEVNTHNTDPLDSDSDNDNLSDGEEVNTYGTDPLDSDSDNDGLSDYDEVNTYQTDPLDSDTDDDGFTDNQEIQVSTDPTSSSSKPYKYIIPTYGWDAAYINMANGSGSEDHVALLYIYDGGGTLKSSASTIIPALGMRGTWDIFGNIFDLARPAVVKVICGTDLSIQCGQWKTGVGGWEHRPEPVTVAAGTESFFPIKGWRYSYLNIANVDSVSVSVTVTVFNGSGEEQATASAQIPPNGMFNTWELIGNILELANPAGVAISSTGLVTVNSGNWNGGTNNAGWASQQLPMTTAAGTQFTFAAGQGDASYLTVSNPNGSSASVQIKIYSQQGVLQYSSPSFTIDPYGTVNSWSVIGDIYSHIKPALVQVTSDQSVVINSGCWNNSGPSGWQMSVLPDATGAGTEFLFPVRGWNTAGYYIANTSDETTLCTIKIYDQNGTLRYNAQTAVAAKGIFSTIDQIGNIYSIAAPAVISISATDNTVVSGGCYEATTEASWGSSLLPSSP